MFVVEDLMGIGKPDLKADAQKENARRDLRDVPLLCCLPAGS